MRAEQMQPSAITRQMLLSWGGKAVFEQAEGIVAKGLVARAVFKDGLIEGIITREAATDLRTRLRLKPDGTIESLCPCYTNRGQGLVCQHVVALGLTLMLRHHDPELARKHLEDERRARRIEQIKANAYLQRAPRGTPARLKLTLPNGWVAAFWQGSVPLQLHLIVGARTLAPEDVPDNVILALSQADDNLLTVLEDICEGPPQQLCRIPAADFINLLLIAAGVDLTVAGETPLKIEYRPVPVTLRVDLDHENGELIVYPQADVPEMREGELPRLLAHGRTGCVIAGERVWPMRDILPEPYHTIYRQDQIIPRDNVPQFLKQELRQLQAVASVEMEVTPDLFSSSPGKPIFHLRLRGTLASLRAELQAAYGKHTFPFNSPPIFSHFSTPDPDDILAYKTRDLKAEKKAIERLRRHGFIMDGDALILVGQRRVLNFLGSSFPSLVRAGWKVECVGTLSRLLEEIPVVTPVVRITDSRDGWFDVGFDYDLPDNTTVTPAQLQQARNRLESYVRLEGERIALFDQEALDAMNAVFAGCQSRESPIPGHFRLPAIQAPFVHASLEALDCIDIEDSSNWRDNAATHNRSGAQNCTPVPLGALEDTLRPYQKEGVYWLAFLEGNGFNGILADEMGLGKTLQALAWLSLPRANPRHSGKPALIVCPTSLVENWNREAATFVPHLRRLVISGPDRAAHFDQIPRSDLVITSYALLRRDLDHYPNLQFSAAILDEAQHIKNRSTQNALAAKQINAANKLVLTGTPIENSVADIWSIMDFLMPEYLGGYDHFRLHYELPIMGDYESAEQAQSKLRRKIHPFLMRRLKRDVAKDLPDKIIKTSFCQLSPEQRRVYDRLLDDSRDKVSSLVGEKGFDRSRFEILALLMRLRQACCHVELLKEPYRPAACESPSAKTEAFFDLLDEAMDGGHRILVFSQFVGMLTILRQELERRGLEYCYLDGSTKDRLDQCQRFNLNPEIPVFLISLKAGGTGLNLTGADMVVHFDPWWNPAVEDQATDRAHRIGQKRTVYSIKLIAEHTIEEKVLDLQQKKQAVIDATIGASDKAIFNKLSFDDIRELIGL